MHELKRTLFYLILGQKGGENRIQIIELIKDRPYNLNQMAETLNLNYRTVKHHIDILLKHEIVTSSESGGYGEVYFLAPKLEENIEMLYEVKDKLHGLTSSPKLFQNVFEQTTDSVIIIDNNMEIMFINQSAETLFGYTSKEVSSKPLDIFTVAGFLNNTLGEVLKGKTVVDVETKALTKGGVMLDIGVTVDSIIDETEKVTGYSVICRDITKRKRMEEELRSSKARLDKAEEIAHLGSWTLDLQKNELVWSDEVYRIFGLMPQEFEATYEAFLERVHPEDREAVDVAYSGSLRDNSDGYEIEHRVIRKDTGEVRIVHEKCHHFRDADGNITHSEGMVHDITDRYSIEDMIEANEEIYRMAFEASPDLFYRISPEGAILDCNSRVVETLGYPKAELIGMSIFNFYAEESKSYAKECFREWQDTGKLRNKVLKILARNGEKIDVSLNVNTIYDNESNVISSISSQRIINRSE